MKICIPSRGPEIQDLVDERFGRAPYFIIHDTESKMTKAHVNSTAGAMGGVGPKAAQFLLNHGVDSLVTERVGGNALEALKAGGIRVLLYEEKGSTVADAITAFLKGNLKEQ
ncbi:MAG TPA: NifB/NifX family molybdenum-iron cluster-binding protein [Methanoregulaceae archaeon]|nr:NifB/NifX family molybdenum-iron cluster-binding protein [Methanoregulaceae archaeon]